MNKSGAIVLKDTGERMIPEFHKKSLIYAEHYTRYHSAANIVNGKIVLDVACGSGYGTKLIAKTASKVFGVDIDEETVRYAEENFGANNIEYKVGDGENIPLEDNSVDVVITFETIEHIPNYKKFIKEVKRVLKPDGLAVVSTPNDLEFAEGNHFHLHEFEYNELINVLKGDFTYTDSYFQGTWKYVALGSSDIFNTEGPVDVKTLNLAPLNPDQYLYFYLVCSNRKIVEKIDSVGAIGAHYSDREQLTKELERQVLSKSLEASKSTSDELASKLASSNEKNQKLEDELVSIKNSRAYKAAVKARTIKSTILRK